MEQSKWRNVFSENQARKFSFSLENEYEMIAIHEGNSGYD